LRGVGGEFLQDMEQNDVHVGLLKLVDSIVETLSYCDVSYSLNLARRF
jgi:hypothetical protein